MIERRGFLKGLALLVAAPALVRAESLMPVKLWVPPKAIVAAAPKFARIVGAQAFFSNGMAYRWEPTFGGEIIVMPGQEIGVRFDECIRLPSLYPGVERQYREVYFEEGGHFYSKVDGLPPIPADASSPLSRFQ